MEGVIWLEKFTRSKNQLSFTFGIDDLRFETSYWYNDVNLISLEEKYGQLFLNKVYFHIIIFEVSKLVSLHPKTIDLGPFAHFHTKEFETLWRKIIHKVWAQWRYEHNFPNYTGPEFTSAPVNSLSQAAKIQSEEMKVLSFCGGGKDSLAAMKLMESAQIPYASFAYSNSIYGAADIQHKLLKDLLKHGEQTKQHQLWVFDSFIDSPMLQLYPEYGVKNIIAAETPSSLFAALPIVLQYGYSYVVVGHEQSANVGNLIWDATGEEVNHQWGKSFEAELTLDEYLQTEFVSNFSYFSILQPIYDVLIFNLLRRDLEAIPDTHSCNIQKPWCCKCSKCAYVWLNYMAYLDADLVNSIFKVNLFDIEENQLWFYQMLGLGKHTPFECIGQISEARLAFELCRKKGLNGKAMEMYAHNFPTLDTAPIINKYLNVDMTQTGIPASIAEKIVPQMQATAQEARQYINSILAN